MLRVKLSRDKFRESYYRCQYSEAKKFYHSILVLTRQALQIIKVFQSFQHSYENLSLSFALSFYYKIYI